MQNSRTVNAHRNMIFGIIQKLFQIVWPFIIRTAMIYILGIEYVGLNSLFTSVIQVLNITELGVGVAMVYSMYKPIADNDKITMCKLLRLYKIYYRVIGLIIIIIGLILTPLIPNLVGGNVPDNVNLYVLYWLNLGYTVLSYWLFAYKSSLLQAHQRSDIISKVSILINTVMFVLQLIIIALTKNYYLYLVSMIVGQILINIVCAMIATQMYPDYQPRGKLEKGYIKEINGRVKDLFTAKIGGVIQNSVDSIVISSFLGLTILARYQNYFYIINSIFGFVTIMFTSVLAGVGNSLITESPEKNYKDFRKITFLTEWIAGFCACCLLCLFQPFMKIWVGEKNELSFGIVVCLCIYFITIVTNQMLCLYKDGSGVWHEDRYRPLIVATINLTMNLLSVKSWGLYGVVLSTVLSMAIVGIPWLIQNLFSSVFKRSSLEFVKELFLYLTVNTIVISITYYITKNITDKGIFTFGIKALICIALPNLLYILIYHKCAMFKEILELLNRLTGDKASNILKYRR